MTHQPLPPEEQEPWTTFKIHGGDLSRGTLPAIKPRRRRHRRPTIVSVVSQMKKAGIEARVEIDPASGVIGVVIGKTVQKDCFSKLAQNNGSGPVSEDDTHGIDANEWN